MKLWPDWRHFGFLTELDGTAIELDRFHRQHAVVELAIRDLKEGAQPLRRPTLRMPTNWPWATGFTIALDALRRLEPATG